MNKNKRLISSAVIVICFAVAFGFALHNFALGIALGIVFGVAFSQTGKPKTPKDK
ncbi:hypothetical protein [Paenibacillus graminis]|uniref:hypothetical protein n=1 Tax=Paenibacillus graminis TaxID=189425 RepID=UPI0004B7B2F5|nr:hypothetical protein [Paenibacillus graminis]